MPWINADNGPAYKSDDKELLELMGRSGIKRPETQEWRASRWYQERAIYPKIRKQLSERWVMGNYLLAVAARKLNDRIRKLCMSSS